MFKEGFIAVPGLVEKGGFFNLSYVTFGDPKSKNVMVCIHGLARNSRDFDYMAQALVDNDYFVISPDMPGRGDSSWLVSPVGYNNATYCYALIALLKALNISRFDFIGTSMGGILGMILASWPLTANMIRNLVINDVGPSIPVATLREIVNYASLNPKFDSLHQAKDYLKLYLSGFGIKDERIWDHLVKYGFKLDSSCKHEPKFDPKIGWALNNEVDQVIGENLEFWEIWNAIPSNINMLLLHGEKSDVLLMDTIKKMFNTKDFSFIEFLGVGHAPSLMTYDQISIVKNWLTTRGT